MADDSALTTNTRGHMPTRTLLPIQYDGFLHSLGSHPDTSTSAEACTGHFTSEYDRHNFISFGTTGVIERLACGHVRKMPNPGENDWGQQFCLRAMARELDVYSRIGRRRHILRLIDHSVSEGIPVFPELQGGLLRPYLQAHGEQTSHSQRLEWARAILATLEMLHYFNVIHADLTPTNIMVDERGLNLHVIDFAGSSIDGKEELSVPNVRFCLPNQGTAFASVAFDLFSFGSTLYEIFTRKQPYQDLGFDDDGNDEVDRLFKQGSFPDVSDVPCGDIILKCWQSKFSSASEAYQELEGCST